MTTNHHLSSQETEPPLFESSSSTFSFIFDPDLAFDWEQRGEKQTKCHSLNSNTCPTVQNGNSQKLYDDGKFSKNNASHSLAETLTFPEEDSLMLLDKDWNLQHHRPVGPQGINHASWPPMEGFTDIFQVQGMHPPNGIIDIPEGCDASPLSTAKYAVERDKTSPAVHAFDYDTDYISKKPAATVTPKTKKASVEIEQAAPLVLTPVGVRATFGTMTSIPAENGTTNSSDSFERDRKRLKLDYIPVDTVDVPLDYTSQRSTIGHQTWRQDEVRGPRRSISEGEAKELIKKHREELAKLGYSREPVFLVKEGNTRAEKDSPLYVWTRNGKPFNYRRASLAAIQHAVNQNSGNTSSKRPSLSEAIKQCEDKLRTLDTTELETGVNVAVMHTTLLALKKEPFYGKDYSSMLQIERVREKLLINMLSRMMQELEPSTITKAPSGDADNNMGKQKEAV